MKADFFCLESFLDCIQRHGTSVSLCVCVQLYSHFCLLLMRLLLQPKNPRQQQILILISVIMRVFPQLFEVVYCMLYIRRRLLLYELSNYVQFEWSIP